METLNSLINLTRPNCIAGEVLFIDGLTRSGKGMLGPILASFQRVEIERIEPMIEYIGELHALGKLERDAAIALLRMTTDQHLFDSMIGRNTNFRWEDHSSVWHTAHPWRYVRRLFLPERQAAMERIARERPIYQNMTHRQLPNVPLYLEAFGARMKMIEMIRHPADLIDSWMRKKKGERIGVDPIINALCIEYRGQALPIYAAGWEEEYLSATPLTRVLRMIHAKLRKSLSAYEALSADHRRQVFLVGFDDFTQEPWRHIETISGFLGTRPGPRTARELRRQRLPRRLNLAQREEKLQALENQTDAPGRRLLAEMCVDYENLASQARR